MMVVNPDLQNERDQASFDTTQLTYFLDNGKDKTERRRYLENLVSNDPEFQGPLYSFLSRDEAYTEGIRKSTLMAQRLVELNITDPDDVAIYTRTVFPNELSPFMLHNGMFRKAVESQTTEEQRIKWLPLLDKYVITGTYAQTELGHGTNVRGLETEATYDPSSQEFVIHSPTVASAKFWPGGLGRTSNSAVVMANLKIGGKNRGMHAFMVQLRDLESHVLCKGVSLGDIGPKVGGLSNDNGYAMFDHVRVPRENMLMKYAKVSSSGVYDAVPVPKITYFTMVTSRVKIVETVGLNLANAVTIAVRYSAVRRQSEVRPGQREPQILDYQTQQYKLLPALATCYAFNSVGKYTTAMFKEVEKEIKHGNFTRIQELHALTAGLKAYTSSVANTFVEQLRLACGGHGYSAASGLPKLYGRLTMACTYEGENTVLLLQTARYMIKVSRQIAQGNHKQYVGTLMGYLCEKLSTSSQLSDSLEINDFVEVFKYRAKFLLESTVSSIDLHMRNGKDEVDATQMSTVQAVKAAEAHSALCIMETFVYALNQASPNLRTVLTRLCRLYGVYNILQHTGDYLQNGYMTGAQVVMLKASMIRLFTEVRPDAVALVDAFDFPDKVLESCIGSYDGNVYERLMEFTKQSPLNKTEVHPTFDKYIQPMRKVLAAKL